MDENWLTIDYELGVIDYIDSYKKEDMLQVHFPMNYVLDMGWYDGVYKLYIIRNYNWETPIYSYSTEKESELFNVLNGCKERIIMLIRQSILKD